MFFVVHRPHVLSFPNFKYLPRHSLTIQPLLFANRSANPARRMTTTTCTMTAPTAFTSHHDSRSPSPVEESDNDAGVMNPAVLEPVMEDLCRFRAELGPDHVKVADTWSSLGLIRLHMQHNKPAAIKCHREALKIYQKNNAPALLQAVTMSDLGGCYERTGDTQKAQQLFQDAMQLLKVTEVPSTHRVHQSISRSIARLNRK